MESLSLCGLGVLRSFNSSRGDNTQSFMFNGEFLVKGLNMRPITIIFISLSLSACSMMPEASRLDSVFPESLKFDFKFWDSDEEKTVVESVIDGQSGRG